MERIEEVTIHYGDRGEASIRCEGGAHYYFNVREVSYDLTKVNDGSVERVGNMLVLRLDVGGRVERAEIRNFRQG